VGFRGRVGKNDIDIFGKMIISGWRKMIISKNDNFVNSKMIISLID